MKVPLYQSSGITSLAHLPPMVAWEMSGYCVAEWFPQMMTRSTWLTATPAFSASRPSALVWSRRVRAVQFSRGMSGAFIMPERAARG